MFKRIRERRVEGIDLSRYFAVWSITEQFDWCVFEYWLVKIILHGVKIGLWEIKLSTWNIIFRKTKFLAFRLSVIHPLCPSPTCVFPCAYLHLLFARILLMLLFLSILASTLTLMLGASTRPLTVHPCFGVGLWVCDRAWLMSGEDETPVPLQSRPLNDLWW